MHEQTLVYGLGKEYLEYEEWIHKHFFVKGYCDQDEQKLPIENGLTKQELKNRIDEFDTILVTADPVSIVADLIDEFSLPYDRIKVLFYEAKILNSAATVFYGENLEDAALMYLFENLGFKADDIKYVEIGTNDPVRYNNSYNFYLRGSRGCLVDPLPAVEYLVRLMRPEDRFINAAISDKSIPSANFYACTSSSISSLSGTHHSKFDGKTINTVKEIKVEIIGINDLFERLGYVPNLLLIDAEGEDEKIIRSIDYNRYRPTVIMVEVDHMIMGNKDLIAYMQYQNYIHFTTIKYNMIFVSR